MSEKPQDRDERLDLRSVQISPCVRAFYFVDEGAAIPLLWQMVNDKERLRFWYTAKKHE